MQFSLSLKPKLRTLMLKTGRINSLFTKFTQFFYQITLAWLNFNLWGLHKKWRITWNCLKAYIAIRKTLLFKYIEKFTTKNRKWKFSDKNSYIFHIPAQHIDCRYSLEPPRPRRGGSNEYHNLSIFLSKIRKK